MSCIHTPSLAKLIKIAHAKWVTLLYTNIGHSHPGENATIELITQSKNNTIVLTRQISGG